MKLDKIKFKGILDNSKAEGRIPNQGTVIFSGKTNSGKSTQLRDVLKEKADIFDYAYCISETETINKCFSNHIPKNLIDREYKQSKLEKVVEFQRKNWIKSDKKSRMVLIMDDCMSDKKFLYHKVIRKLFLEARHYGILFLLCTQYFMDVPKGLRANVEYVSFGPDNNIETRKNMYKTFFGFFPTFKEFDTIFKKYTSNYSVIFIKPAGRSYEIKDNMYFYKSKSYNRHGEYKHEFRIGSPAIWAKCKERRRRQDYLH